MPYICFSINQEQKFLLLVYFKGLKPSVKIFSKKNYFSSCSPTSPAILIFGVRVFAPDFQRAGQATPGLADINWRASIFLRSSSEFRPRGPEVTSIPRMIPSGSMIKVPRPAIPVFSSRRLYASAVQRL
jgi:hypothetical protein